VLFHGEHCGIKLSNANHHLLVLTLLISVFAFLVTVTIIVIDVACLCSMVWDIMAYAKV
jgi:hypothetical protein